MKSKEPTSTFIEIPASNPPRPIKYCLFYKEGEKIKEQLVNKSSDFNYSSMVIKTVANSSGPLPFMFEEYRDHYDSLPQVVREIMKSAIKKIRWQMASRDNPSVFFDTRFVEPGNVAHLMICLIPLILTIKKEVGANVDFIFYKLGDHFLKLLNYFDIQPKLSAKRCRGERVILFARRDFKLVPYDLYAMDQYFLKFFPEIYKNCKIKKTLTAPKVFMARKNKRAFINENEIDLFLSKYGFQKFYLEDLTIEDQISLAAHAEYVVATSGAALSYLVLNPSLKGVVEVSTPNFFEEFLAEVLSCKTDRYITILPELDWNKVMIPWEYRVREKDSNFKLDMIFLEKAMEALDLK